MQLELVSHIPRTVSHETPILFLHGAWHGAWCWEANFMPYFAERGYAAYAMSLRAHGSSEGRSQLRWSSVADYVADLVMIVDSLPQPPVIVAHSLGGFVLQKYLEDYDSPAAILIAPASPRAGWKFTARSLRQMPLTMLRALATLTLYPIVGTPERAQKTFFSAGVEIEPYFPQIQDESYRAYLDFLLLALPDTRRIRERRTPMLILGAADDHVFPAPEVEALGQLYDAPVVVLPDTAHDVMLEPGWQAAAEQICHWLEEQQIA